MDGYQPTPEERLQEAASLLANATKLAALIPKAIP